MIRFLVRLFSYLFNTGLALALTLLGLVALLAGAPGFELSAVPWWTGTALAKALLAAGLIGILATWLAIRGKARALLPLWNLCTLGVMIYGYFWGSYKFDGMDEFRSTLWTAGGNALALLGSFSQMFRRSA
ncbi:MAG: hypothetical protein R2762_16890 [Bryobacteraceae bacterium]